MPSGKQVGTQGAASYDLAMADPGGRYAELVERAATNYLNRFDSSVANLRQVLTRQMDRKLAKEEVAAEERQRLRSMVQQGITELLERYQRSGMLNDARLANNLVGQYRRRGTSTRAIRMKLRKKGIPELIADQAILDAEPSEETELTAAIAYAKRRRLGPYRRSETSADRARKDLAALARAGFDFTTARQALATSDPSTF